MVSTNKQAPSGGDEPARRRLKRPRPGCSSVVNAFRSDEIPTIHQGHRRSTTAIHGRSERSISKASASRPSLVRPVTGFGQDRAQLANFGLVVNDQNLHISAGNASLPYSVMGCCRLCTRTFGLGSTCLTRSLSGWARTHTIHRGQLVRIGLDDEPPSDEVLWLARPARSRMDICPGTPWLRPLFRTSW